MTKGNRKGKEKKEKKQKCINTLISVMGRVQNFQKIILNIIHQYMVMINYDYMGFIPGIHR